MKRYFILLLSKGAWTDEVDAQGVPRNQLWVLGRKSATLVVAFLQAFTSVATGADAAHHWTLSNEGKMLSHCHLWTFLARM